MLEDFERWTLNRMMCLYLAIEGSLQSNQSLSSQFRTLWYRVPCRTSIIFCMKTYLPLCSMKGK